MSKKNFSVAHSRAILPGQIWLRTDQREWRVMAVAEGFAMGRLKGCSPGIIAIRDMASWTLATLGKRDE
jgi:hypothetical protein